jgi:RNA polymerase sigma-70 factor (ECF subfamily)
MLASDAILYSDGGGKAPAAFVPIRGAAKVARFFVGVRRKLPAATEAHPVRVNGQPGVITTVNGQVTDVITLDIIDGRIANCFIIRNPEKLARVVLDAAVPGTGAGSENMP